MGRRPNGKAIDAEAAGVQVNERGFIPVDNQMRTNVPHIYAIGDIVGEPMLAHKASHEGKLAAEVIAGHKAAFDARTIPSVAYTDPEVAWMGLTETQAKAQGIEIEKAVFPWAASGRARATARDEGITKLLFDKSTRRLLGAAIVGPNAGELIAETVLALEMGADAAGHRAHHPSASDACRRPSSSRPRSPKAASPICTCPSANDDPGDARSVRRADHAAGRSERAGAVVRISGRADPGRARRSRARSFPRAPIRATSA